ncbi:TetR/AcrR family transcriptional regulator [Amycolatopsis minnesotensis]|uniref:TetR/AcrR family transcriptional regulator n=1 Tax=Amycolatopsis minnesotensis TaxID=337894 RepID=A0ABN2SL93_9PSEU
MAGAGTSPRERYRTQLRAEIKEHAWEQIATAGASALSLKAIAKQLGMSGPALYRYYASRDDLITELIRDAYRSLADALAAGAEDGGLAGLGHALRGWALAEPHRYHLLYGTPVPGYHAPQDTAAITSQIMGTLLDACRPHAKNAPDTAFDEHLAGHRLIDGEQDATAATVHRALSVWTRLHGVLSLELAGHFTGMDFDPVRLYEAELDSLLAP